MLAEPLGGQQTILPGPLCTHSGRSLRKFGSKPRMAASGNLGYQPERPLRADSLLFPRESLSVR